MDVECLSKDHKAVLESISRAARWEKFRTPRQNDHRPLNYIIFYNKVKKQ